MTLTEVVAECARLNVKLFVDGAQLRVRAAQGAVTAELRTALAEHKAGLIARLRSLPASGGEPGRIAPRTGEYPLSFSQNSLWLLHRAEPASLPAYNVRAARRFQGALDVARMETAIRLLIHRHHPLRTIFIERAGAPAQQVVAEAEFALVVTDLSESPEQEREARWRSELDHEGRRAFDTGSAPLFSVRLFKLASDEHVLLFNAHHLIADAWSTGLLLYEIADAYRGGTPRQENVAFGFPDYVLDQRRRLEGEGLTPHLEYWRTYLDQVPALELQTDFPRPRIATYEGASVSFELDQLLDRKLRDFATGEGFTLFQVLITAYAVLLFRMSGQSDFGIGYTLAGRDRVETESLLGYFVNLVTLRPELAGNMSFRALLRQSQRRVAEAFEHQEVPFDRIVRELRVPREPGRNPLFQALFLYLQAPRRAAEFEGLKTVPLEVPSVTSKYDLSLHIEDRGNGLSCLWEYNTRLFRSETVEQWSGRFAKVLTALVAEPDGLLQTISILSAQEGLNLLEVYNQTNHPVPATTIPALFEVQAAKTPNAVALSFEDRLLTYHELNAWANSLAHHLIARGVGPEDVVGIRMERSLEMVVALLGVQKAGAAYLPLDPEYPAARLAFMVSDAEPAAVLEIEDVTALIGGKNENPTDADRKHPLQTDHPAYVIYTSGSTGQPKGAPNTHRAIVNRLLWAKNDLNFCETDRVLQKTPYSFDVSVWEFFLPLLCGGRLVMALPGKHREPRYLVETINRERITTIHFVPSMLRAFLEEPGCSSCRTLKTVVCSGEALSEELQTQFFTVFQGVELHNLYGPTEAAVDVTSFNCQPGDVSTPPIGAPIWNTRTYVLDPALEPVLPGTPGELFLAGTCLARGYLKRPDLTAERFVPDPHGAPGTRMYRTGDLARWRSDANLDYLGRLDHQVKIRGLRIELGEIETALLQQPGVGRAAVTARDDGPGGKMLVAYIVPLENCEVDPDALRTLLSQTLPDYMVPAAFVLLNEFPLTASGKLDRKSLPAPERKASAWREPQTPAEEVLCRLFAELLSLPRVGIDDNFFSLGGDSIISIVLVSRARQAGLDFTPGDVFQHQTVKAIAGVAKTVTGLRRQQDTPVGPIVPTPIMQWLFERGAAIRRFSQSVLLRAPAGLREEHLLAGLGALVQTHSALRLGHEPLRVEPMGGTAVRECLQVVKGLVTEAAALEAEGRLDPASGRVVEAVWFPDAARLLLVIHHLAVDGVSWRILVPDLAAACEAAARGERPELEPEGTPFRIWAEHLQRLALSPGIKAQLVRWENVTRAGAQFLPAAVLDPHRDVVATQRSIRVSVSASITQALLTTIPEAFHAGVNDVLLAALAIAANDREILVDVEGHGRELADGLDVSRTVGWFTSLFPVRLHAAGLMPALALKTVKEQLRSVPDRGLSYGLLRYSNPETAPLLAAREQAQIGFNYLGRVSADLSTDWTLATEQLKLTGADPELALAHLIEVNALTTDGPEGPVLSATWSWAGEALAEATVRQLADSWLSALVELTRHAAAGGHTPSDFAMVDVSQIEVERVEALYPGLADLLPLTPLQEGLLFHSLFEEQGPDAYTVQVALQLRGDLDAARLRAAAETMLARHENLRVGICLEGLAKPVQAVVRNASLPWRVIEGSTDLQEVLAADRAERFQLAAGPLLRFTLVHLGPESYTLIFTCHHLLMDGWSLPVFFEEMLEFYAGSSLAPVQPYRDYLAWLSRQDTADAYARWAQYLSGFAEPTRLANSPERDKAWQPPVRLRKELPREQTSRLQDLARARGLTLNTVFQGLWAVLLWRLTGRTQVAFGVTVSGRPPELPGVERIIGLFINTLPLRVNLNPAESLVEQFVRIQNEQAAMLPYQQVSVAEIQRAAGLGKLFDTLLVFENYPLDRASFGEVSGIRIESAEGRDTSHYPLSLIVVPGERLELRLDYLPTQFERSFAESLLKRIVGLLEQTVANPEAPARDFAIVDQAERRLLLEPFYKPISSTNPALTLPQLFEAQVERTPDCVAVVFGESKFTYKQLNDRANQLAHHLIVMGAGPEKLVGFCLEPSFETVVAILGIQKAGAAYLPMDREYPLARIEGMVADAEPVCVLTPEWFEANRTALEQSATENPRQALDPEHPAYVIYTSGSTGKPKGVPVTHHNVVRLFDSTRQWFSFGPEDVWTLFHSSAFDFSVWEIWGALLFGGRLVVVPKLLSRSPEEFLTLLADERITVLNQTPSAFYQLMLADRENPEPGRRLSLRYIVFGGEALDLTRLEDWYSRHPDGAPVLVNMYGITETTVHVSYQPLDRTLAQRSKGSIIGGNIPDLKIYVLDEMLEPAATGVPGEMYVAGKGLARGYLKRSALTAERFLPDPYGAPGTRMYRTGDLARFLPGEAGGALQLEYLGRCDHQVKIRGFRIELGEIEAVLEACSGVAQAAAIVRDAASGEKQLVAYVVPREGLEIGDLRPQLAQKLPEYMLPAAIVTLETLPLTPHGKLDRAALPAPAAQTRGARLAPRDAEEQAIAAVWEEVLGQADIGVTDNFFALGGHSLLATRVMTRLRERCGVKVPLRSLFEHPTVETLARSMRALAPAPVENSTPLKRVSRQRRQITVDEHGAIGSGSHKGNS